MVKTLFKTRLFSSVLFYSPPTFSLLKNLLLQRKMYDLFHDSYLSQAFVLPYSLDSIQKEKYRITRHCMTLHLRIGILMLKFCHTFNQARVVSKIHYQYF